MSDIFRTIFYPLEIIMQIFGVTHCKSVLLNYKMFNVARGIRKTHNIVNTDKVTEPKPGTYRCKCDDDCKNVTTRNYQCLMKLEELINRGEKRYCHCGRCRIALNVDR